jgi:hypothetical protein
MEQTGQKPQVKKWETGLSPRCVFFFIAISRLEDANIVKLKKSGG